MCADDGELIFTSERPVIAWLLLGSLKALIKILFRTPVTIKIEPVEDINYCYRYLFSATNNAINKQYSTEKNSLTQFNTSATRTNSLNVSDFSINSSTFCKAFPWHFIMNDQLQLFQMGMYLQ